LRILQYLKNPVLARKCAAKLLGMALDSEDMELVQDLMRFLDPIEDSEAEEEGILGSENESGVGRGREGTGSMNDDGLTEDDEEFLMVEVLLSRYARKLLSQHQLKQLLRFAGMVNRPLQPWLVRERLVFS
jgi:hypothetical protein